MLLGANSSDTLKAGKGTCSVIDLFKSQIKERNGWEEI
jgi:hypothetical protein